MKMVLLEEPIETKRLNEIAKKEKLGNGKPPISELHYWWTRKPLITSRAVLLASLSDQLTIEQLEELSGLDRKAGAKPTFTEKPWKGPYIKDIEVYNKLMERAKALYGDPVIVFDPFAGSGMIGFEALRLGLNVVLLDYNPVAYLIMKATIEYPKKYGDNLVKDVKREAERILGELREELSALYPKHNGRDVLAYILCWEVKCKSCGELTPLAGGWRLSDEEYLAYEKVGGALRFSIKKGEAPQGNVDRGNATCLLCGMPIPNSEMVEDIKQNQRERLLAVVLEDRTYDVPNEEDVEASLRASEILRSNWTKLGQYIPDEEAPLGVVRSAKYLPLWRDLFNQRQLLLLATMAKKIRETVEKIESEKGKGYAEAVGAYLSIWLAKHVDYNSRACHWIHRNTQIGHSLANRRPSMMWVHPEVNPFVKFSGSLGGMLHDVLDALQFSVKELRDTEVAQIYQKSILQYDAQRKFKLIITDPPYADDVPYPELSEFFYVWHKRTIGHLLSFSSTHVDTAEEIDIGGDRFPEDFYARFLSATRKLYQLLDDDGLLIVFFAHRNLGVWENVINIFADVGFHITNAVPLSTESENNVIAQGKRSVYYSLIITARKRGNAVSAELQDVIREINEEIERSINKVTGLGYNQGEVFLWATGVALKHFTKYSRIESFDRAKTAKTALQSAQDAVILVLVQNEIEKIAKRKINVDKDTAFYIYTLKSGKREMDTDTFNQTVKALGLDENALFGKHLVEKKGDGKKTTIYLNDAFSRSSRVKVEGRDAIEGQALIDYFHKTIVSYSLSPGLQKVDEAAYKAGIASKDFVDLIRTIQSIEYESESLKQEKECVVSGKIVSTYDQVRG